MLSEAVIEQQLGLLPQEVPKGEAKLSEMVGEGLMTDAGKAWLTAALDPMHDGRISGLRGYPDLNTSNSVMQVIRKSFTILPPSSAPANWDCHVVMWPLALSGSSEASTFKKLGLSGSTWCFQDTTGTETVYVGGVTAQGLPPGTTSYTGNSGIVTTAETADLTGYVTDSFRVIGCGFEVLNTTSELYKQGLVTVYEQPFDNALGSVSSAAISTSGSFAAPNPPTYQGPASYRMGPPNTVAEALGYPSSKQWEAWRGVYCVLSQTNIDNPPVVPSPLLNIVLDAPYLSTESVFMGQPLTTSTVNSITISTPQVNVALPFSMKGAYFTGLSQQTSLQVNCVWYVEKFPCTSDFTLAVMAQPSPSLDINALRIAAESWEKLPVGVPAGMNPLGEWFEEVVNVVADVAAPALTVGSMLFPEFAPILAPLGAAAGAVGNITGQRIQNRKQKRRQKKAKKKQQQQQQIGGTGSSKRA
jgi:hypothetical protein